MDYYVSRFLFMNDCRTRLHCICHCENRRVLFIFDLNQCESLLCGDFSLSNDNCDVITIESDSLVQELPVGNVLMFLFRGPRMPCCRILYVRDVEACEYLHDSWYLTSLIQIE